VQPLSPVEDTSSPLVDAFSSFRIVLAVLALMASSQERQLRQPQRVSRPQTGAVALRVHIHHWRMTGGRAGPWKVCYSALCGEQAAEMIINYETELTQPEPTAAHEYAVSAVHTEVPIALAEHVAHHLRDLVVRGVLKPGEHIVERRLCREIGVSRTPMREALKLLRADGLVEISRNRGARVTDYSAEDAIALFEVIGALEGAAAERVAAGLDEDALAHLEAMHAEMRSHYDAGRLDAYFGLNTAIHDAIVDGCGNALLAESRRRLMLRARQGRYMAIMDAERWRQAMNEHETLMVALRRRDPAKAGAVWREHLRSTGDSVAAALSTN
jgi:DNA-binding GntR family transcriptional regulator